MHYQFVTAYGNTTTSEYRIPLRFSTPCTEPVVDFAFGKSNGPLQLLSSLTVFLLQANGTIGCASPIVWDQSIVPATTYDETRRTLTTLLSSLLHRGTTHVARRKQALAAQRFLIDVFAGKQAAKEGVRNLFYQANLNATEASRWPVVWQSHILHPSTTVDYTLPPPSSKSSSSRRSPNNNNNATPLPLSSTQATSLQVVPAAEMTGLIVGRLSGWVEWAIVHPVAILPLFTLASLQDRMEIGNAAALHAQWVERVYLHQEEEEEAEEASNYLSSPQTKRRSSTTTNKALTIVSDPVSSETLTHVVVPTAVYTISTNALFVATKQLKSSVDSYYGVEVPHKRTTAWATVASLQANIRGVALWSSSADDRGMSVRLSDDSSTVVHVTQQQYRHELETLFPTPSTTALQQQNAANHRLLDSAPPFYETIQPVVDTLNRGLDNMAKIVGSETMYQDITPELMAVALQVKERCEKQVSVPLLELVELIKRRQKALAEMVVDQQEQLNQLLQQKEDLAVEQKSIESRLAESEAKMNGFVQRSIRIRETLLALAPTMSTAEMNFCRQMEQTKAKLAHWQVKADKLLVAAQEQLQAMKVQRDEDFNQPPPDVTPLHEGDHMKRIQELTKFNDVLLVQTRKRLHAVDEKLRTLASSSTTTTPQRPSQAVTGGSRHV